VRPKSMRFVLDENLPKRAAQALGLVGYPVDTFPEDKRGTKDPELLRWMAQKNYIWVTKDLGAQREHGVLMKKLGVSVIWLRGHVGRESALAARDVHLLLTTKLDSLLRQFESACGPLYFTILLTKAGPRLMAIRDDDIG